MEPKFQLLIHACFKASFKVNSNSYTMPGISTPSTSFAKLFSLPHYIEVLMSKMASVFFIGIQIKVQKTGLDNTSS